ncbi:hypothetical protein D3C78_1062330 [compost metagenome]
MLHDAIAEGRRADDARLRLEDLEGVVGARLVAAIDQALVQVVDLRGEAALEQIAGATGALAFAGGVVALVERGHGKGRRAQVTGALHGLPRWSSPRLPKSGQYYDFAQSGRKTSPSFPVSPYRVSGGIESAQKPTLSLEFVRLLFKLTAQGPAFVPLFQFMPEIGQSMSR